MRAEVVADTEDQLVLPLRVVPQPTPNVYPYGDCGGCVLAGLFNLTVPEAYERFRGKVDSLSWYEMRDAFAAAVNDGLAEHCIREFPEWPLNRYVLQSEFGLTAWHQGSSYWHYLRMALAGGYYGATEVNFARKGPDEPADHWVLLCGTRLQHKVGCGWEYQILVSCSARTTPAEEWVEVHEFLKRRGGFHVLLVKPRIAGAA